MGPVDDRAAAIGRDQRGRVTRRQLREDASISPATIARRMARGRWSEPLPNVIDLGTHRSTWLSDLQELLLATGPESWLCHLTAAHLHGFLDVGRPGAPDLLVRRGAHTKVGDVRLHTTMHLAVDEVTSKRGLRCTSAARTFLDLGPTSTLAELERFALNLARRDRATLRQIGGLLDRYRRLPARRRLTTALGRLPGDASLLGSPLEVLAIQELLRLGAARPRLQYPVRDLDGAFIKRVDAAWPAEKALAEFDGAAYHDTTEARADDEEARHHMRALGWRVEVFRRGDLGGPRMRAFAADLRG